MNEFVDKRSSPRTSAEKYYSVEFSIFETGSLYQFKIRDISPEGMCILVKENSAVLRHIKVGDRLEMKYHSAYSPSTSELLNTEIRHITKQEEGLYRGHYLIGLFIVYQQMETESQ